MVEDLLDSHRVVSIKLSMMDVVIVKVKVKRRSEGCCDRWCMAGDTLAGWRDGKRREATREKSLV